MVLIRRRSACSRRYGCSIWGSAKDTVNTRNYPPGQHGLSGYKKLSSYGKQLKAKRQLQLHYNMSERQFRNFYMLASKMRGNTNEAFIFLLESRLDSFVYRSKFCPSIFSAKQFVSHKHVLVNGKVINIPSYRLKVGDKVSIRRHKKSDLISGAVNSGDRDVPEYIESHHDEFYAIYKEKPLLEDVPYAFKADVGSIVAFYSS